MGWDIESVVIGTDHAGYAMKEFLKTVLAAEKIEYTDVGTNSAVRVDYPVYSAKVAKLVNQGVFQRGIALCGSGIGASIIANRYRGVRAALCTTEEMAALSRQHNDANILVLGGRIISLELAEKIVKIWLHTPFQGGVHHNRILMIDTLPYESDKIPQNLQKDKQSNDIQPQK